MGKTILGPPSPYVDLLDQITAIDPSRDLAVALVSLSEEPIEQEDPLKLLLLAEWAAENEQWQAAAQLFCRMMASAFGRRYTEAALVEQAKCVVLLISGHPVELGSAADLVLYGHTRLVDVLHHDGIESSHNGEWIVPAFCSLLHESPARIAALQAARTELQLGNRRIGEHYRSEIGPMRRVLECSFRLRGNDQAWVWIRRKGLVRNVALLALAVIGIAWFAWAFRHWFPVPVSAALDRYSVGSWLRAAYIAWPLLLVATWFFALAESNRTRTFQFVSPTHLLGDGWILAGEIMPFSRDWFFHIFQFIWVLFVVAAWLLFSECKQLPDWLPSVWNYAKPNATIAFSELITVPFVPYVPQWGGSWSHVRVWLGSDLFSLAVATGFCILSIWLQRKIQRQRILRGKDFYWWDRRANPIEWRVRLIMVGVDMFLVAFLLLKILAVLFAAYQLVLSNSLKISYFAPDGVGGLNQLVNVLMYLSWIGFVSGVFVFASLYLHWNLREYRKGDLALVVAYMLFVALTIAPLLVLDSKLSIEGDSRMAQLTAQAATPSAKLEDLGKYVRDVSSVQSWRVSAIKMGVLKNPVLPLSFQLLVIFLQSLGRLGKLPKLPIPGFGESDASKGGHGGH
jgi:hypothetical protein